MKHRHEITSEVVAGRAATVSASEFRDARAPVSIIMATTNRLEECCYLASVLVTAVIASVALAQPA